MGQSTYKILVEADVSKLVSDVQKGLQQIEKRGSDLNLLSNADFSSMLAEFRKVLNKMKAEAESLKLGKVDTAVIDTKPIDDLLKKFKNINKEIDTLNSKLQTLSAGASFDGLSNKFATIKSDLESINNLLTSGGLSKQPKTASNISKELAETIQLYKQLNDIQQHIKGKTAEPYDKSIDTKSLEQASAAAEITSDKYDQLASQIIKVERAFAEAQKSGDKQTANKLLVDRINLYSQLTQTIREYQGILNAIDNSTTFNMSTLQMDDLFNDLMRMEKFLDKRAETINKLRSAYQAKIPGKYFTDTGIDESKLTEQTTTSASNSGKLTVPINVVVTKQQSTIKQDIDSLLETVQARVTAKPIEIPVKVAPMAVKGDGIKNKTTGLEEGLPTQVTTVIKTQVDTDIAATKQIIKSNIEEIQNVLKSAKLSLPDITVPENFTNIVKELREYQKAQATITKSTKSTTAKTIGTKETPVKTTSTSTASASTIPTPKIDATALSAEIKQSMTVLLAAVKDGLAGSLSESLNKEFTSISQSIQQSFTNTGNSVVQEINKIVSALEKLQSTMRTAFKFDTDAQLQNQWSSIEKQFTALSDASGKIDMRKKGINDLLSSMQAYQSKGGTKTFEDLTKNATTLSKLYDKQQKLNANTSKAETTTQNANLKLEVDTINNLTAAMQNAANAIKGFSDSNITLLNSSKETVNTLTTLIAKVEELNQALASQTKSSATNTPDKLQEQAQAAQSAIQARQDAISQAASGFGTKLNDAFGLEGKTNAFVQQLGNIQQRYESLKSTLSSGKINFGDSKQAADITQSLRDLDTELSKLIKNKGYNIRQGKGTVLDNILFSDPSKNFDQYQKDVVKYASNLGKVIDKSITTDNVGTIGLHVQDINGQVQKLRFEWDQLNNTVKLTQTTTGASLSGIQQFATSLKSIFSTFKTYFSGQRMFFKAIAEIKEGFNFVKDLDASLTTMSMTMDTTDSAMSRMGDSSIQMAKKLGSTVDSVTAVGEIYANMNESVDSILAKSEPTVALANATGLDVSTAADTVQGVVNQYKELEGQEEYIVSSLEKVSAEMKMNFGDGVEYMSQALQKSGSVAKEAGMEYETFIATAGKISEITRQSGDVTGNAMKTIVARLGRITDPDEEALSASEVSDIAKAYKSVGINVYNANGEFQDIEVTLSSLAEKWDSLTDAERSYVAEKSAGTRQKNTFMVWMNEYKEIEKLAQTAAESHGFMDEVQSKHEESLTARINTLKATGQETWNNILGGDEANATISFLTQVLELLNGITEQAGLIPTIFAGITMTGLTKSGGRIKMLILNMVYATEAFSGNMYELS